MRKFERNVLHFITSNEITTHQEIRYNDFHSAYLLQL